MVFIGIKGTVLSLDRATGEEIWRTKLKGDFVNLVLQDGSLYATASGELFCLDPASGEIRWHNQLKGLGMGIVSIATADGQQAVLTHQKAQEDANAAAGTTSAIG
jgi:outer membrane protein assembly factor BamB